MSAPATDRTMTTPGETIRPVSGVTPRVRLVLAVVTAVILAFPIVDLARAALKPNFNGYGGIDYTLYMAAS